MTRPLAWVTAATVAYVAGVVVRAALAYGPASIGSSSVVPTSMALLLPSILLGWLVAVRAPGSPIGPALALTGALPALVFTVEDWGSTYRTAHAWPGARSVEIVSAGVWAWLFLGFAILVLVFPDGLLPGRRWRAIAIAVPLCLALVNFVVATDIDNFSATPDPERVTGEAPFALPTPLRAALIVGAFAGLIGVLLAVSVSLVSRFRRGDELTRLRLRWLMCAAISVPVLLATSWLAIAAGLPGDIAYLGFLIAMLFLVPAAIAVAILRHDLLDIDHVFGTAAGWLITTVISAAIFAGVVVAVDTLFPRHERAGVTSAAFITALLLLPLHTNGCTAASADWSTRTGP